MATLQELINLVKTKVQDSSFDTPQILVLFNSCLRRSAYKANFPSLESTGTFKTNPLSNKVSIPSEWNFQRSLYAASVADGPKVTVLSSAGILFEKVPNFDTYIELGDIKFITYRAGELLYTPIPLVTTTVTCKFFKNPEPLVESDLKFEIELLPEALHESLLVNYATWKCYEDLESGVDGLKTNTAYYKNEFTEALNDLRDIQDVGQTSTSPYRENGWI